VALMGKGEVYTVFLVGKLVRNLPLGMSKSRWKDNIKMGFQELCKGLDFSGSGNEFAICILDAISCILFPYFLNVRPCHWLIGYRYFRINLHTQIIGPEIFLNISTLGYETTKLSRNVACQLPSGTT
jgi:hypothetical protein